MSTPGAEKNRRADPAAAPTGDFSADRITESAAGAAVGRPDPLLSLLCPSQAAGELGRLAHFAVTRLLGQGGMGAVFAADDLLLHRKVALKVMRPELTVRPEARERFLREAQTAGGLEHDHVIPVHEVAEDNGVWFIAMPLLKGEALDARLAREDRLSIPAVLKIGRETAEGLAAAHAQGLVHRDVKPANLWLEARPGEPGGLSPRFRIKVLDFGLARAVQDDQHLTGAGGVLGTPAYMAPEQAAGEEVDHRADLFSLGAVLYRCCAGELPFRGPNTMAVLSALANKDAVPVGEKNPAVPAALADLIMRLLAKAPGDRPQSAAELTETLRRIEQQHTTVTVPIAKAAAPQRRRVPVRTLCVAALLVLAAVAAVIVVKVRTPDGKETQITAPTGSKVDVDPKGNVTVALPADGANQPADPPELEFRLKEGSSEIHAMLITPDGKKVVAGYRDGYLRVWDLESRKIVQTYNAGSWIRSLALHPDGKTVAVNCEDGSLLTWDTDKSEVVRRFDGYPVVAWGAAFARGGDLLVTPDEKTKAVVCWVTATGEHRVIASYPDKTARPALIQATPDGDYIAVADIQGPIRLVKVPSGDLVWESPWQSTANPVFDEAGKNLIFSSPGGRIMDCNRETMRPERVFSSGSPLGCNGIAVGQNGRLLAAAGRDGSVYLWVRDRPAAWREWSGLATGSVLRIAFTPDGKRMLSTHNDGTICVFKIPDKIPVWRGFPPLDPDWIARTTKLTPEEQVKAVTAELALRNPGFADVLSVQKDNDGQVGGIDVNTSALEDLSPLRAFPALHALTVRPKQGIGKVWDLSCLEGLRLTWLDLRYNCVCDLSPLRDMPLTSLLVDSNPLIDLSPLRTMKVQYLGATSSLISDLNPLKTTPIDHLFIHYTPVKDLSPLKGTPLKFLELNADGAADFESLRGLSIEAIELLSVEQTGLTAAQAQVLRSIPTLKTINGKPASDFWKAIDAGEKPKPP